MHLVGNTEHTGLCWMGIILLTQMKPVRATSIIKSLFNSTWWFYKAFKKFGLVYVVKIESNYQQVLTLSTFTQKDCFLSSF